MKKYLISVLVLAIVCSGCAVTPPKIGDAPKNEETPKNEIAQTVPLPPDAADTVFSSNGNAIYEWYWLRDFALSHYAEWTINNIPKDFPTIELNFYVLATDKSNGGGGYDAKFLLYYGASASGPLRVKTVTLPNVSTPDNQLGYDCRGAVLIPTADLAGSDQLYVKVMRADAADHHIAFKKESIETINGTSTTTESGDQAQDQTDSTDDLSDSTDDSADGLTDGSGDENLTVEVDSDNDGLFDSQELLYGLNKNSPDTDGDGVGDLSDLSPLMNPAEPTLNDYYPKGMVRIQQQIEAIGLDGWVEKYHKVYKLFPPSSYYVHDYTDEDEGTKKSTMDYAHYIAALDKVFSESKFKSYRIEDKTPADFAVQDVEKTHDYVSDGSLTYAAGFTHPNEYRFYYDWITDYALAYLKNSEPIKYPDDDNYFRLILQPLKLATGKENTISIQFTSNQIYQALNYTDDNHYKAPALVYTLYSTDNYDSDENIIMDEGLTLAMIESTGQFQADITIRANKATQQQTYLKISPVWYVKNGSSETYDPMVPSWNITGLSRGVKLLEDSEGSSNVIVQEFKNWDGLNSAPVDAAYLSSKSLSTDYKNASKDMKTIQFDPAKTSQNYTVTESDYDVQTYVEKTGGEISGFISQAENMVTAKWKIDDISDLPETHWARSPKYNAAVASLGAAQGVMSLVSDGTSAWTAYKEGNNIDVVYYSAQAGLDVVGTASSLVSISERTIGYAGKAGKLAKLTTKKAAVGLAIAAGVVEVSYNAYHLATTDDPILKLAYEEKIGASVIDTGISVAAVFSPHVLAFQLTWTAEAEIYSLIFGEDFAYQIAQSPGSALVFLNTYFVTGGIDSTMAQTAYLDTRDQLIAHLELFNSVKLPYLTIFIDPDL